MSEVYCVFQIKYGDEQFLWKIFDTKEKADNWIEEYGQWAMFEIEKWTVC